MRAIDADHLKRWILSRWEHNERKGYGPLRPDEILNQIDRELTVKTEPEWIPCHIINQCYIPELKRIGYSGILVTYVTRTGKRLVREMWIECGRIVGKQTKGDPIAYMPLPEPYKGGQR